MNQQYALELSTVLKEPKKFLVDGEEFNLLGIDHLTPESEAETMALFSRLNILTEELEAEANVTKGTKKAIELKETRIVLLTKLTTLNRSTAVKLPLTQQVLLLEAIQKEVSEDSGIEPEQAEEQKTPGQVAAEARAAAEAAGVGAES